MITAITFETFQQLFYIKNFKLAENISFFYLLKNQSYRWFIWFILGIGLFWYAKRQAHKSNLDFRYFLKYFLFILFLVVANIIIISSIQLLISEQTFSLALLVSEYIPFYIFQKAPIYILGYCAIAIILHLYFDNEKLQIEVQKLSDLKDINLNLYNKLKSNIEDKTTILNIKIGNRRKIISVEDIIWIEADDYCAKVHLTHGKSYTMRSSLKALEEKLQAPFLRVHRKAIVNMKMAQELNTQHSPVLVLNNNMEVPVAKSNLKAIKAFIS